MKMENRSCCFCFNIASGGNVVTTDILNLLKFLITNLNTNSFENSPVCDGCLSKILETCEYKMNSMKMLMETKKEIINCEKPIICQKCKSLCAQGHSLSLVDCVIKIDWSDFVNYLFPDQDSQSLKSLQVCGTCQITVSNIQDFLKLIYVHDQGKLKCDIDNSSDINRTENENLMRDKVEIKQEFEHFVNDKIEIQKRHLNENIKVKMIHTDNKGDGDITYADLKSKNEEVELKLENEKRNVNQSTDRYEKADVPQEKTLCGGPNRNSFEEQGVNSQGCTNKLSYDLKVQNTIQDFNCVLCSKHFSGKIHLDNHLLIAHKNRDNITSKIHECDKCSYSTTRKFCLMRHKLKHGLTVGHEIYKCQHCIYETYDKSNFIKHIKTYNNTRDFNCTLCSKSFTDKRNLYDHSLKVHKNKDNIVSKIHECDKCNYLTTKKSSLLRHKLQHNSGT